MKKKICFFSAGLLVALYSCSNDETANTAEAKLTGELTAMVTRTAIPEPEKPDTGESGGSVNPVPSVPETPREEYIAFTGADIKSFNITTREIVFNDLTV